MDFALFLPSYISYCFFFFNETATTEIYTLSLHDALPISATTCEPGASEVFTHGLTVKPFATALRASSPAPIMTLGFDVLVHEVMAAMTTSPWPRSCWRPGTGTRFDEPALEKFLSSEVASEGWRSKMSLPPSPPLLNSFSIAMVKPALTSLSATRSCGRLGPASEGSTCDNSSLSTSVKMGSGVDLVRYIPCALLYAAT